MENWYQESDFSQNLEKRGNGYGKKLKRKLQRGLEDEKEEGDCKETKLSGFKEMGIEGYEGRKMEGRSRVNESEGVEIWSIIVHC